VRKGRLWYLVAGTDKGQRTFRVDRARSVEETGEPVVRPREFDLSAAWRSVAAEVDAKRAPYEATACVEPDALGWLQAAWGNRAHPGRTLPDGRVEIRLRGYSARQVAMELAGLGSRIEVRSPKEVRAHLARLGTELAALYAPRS
jgi:predicted DNA-binding transcriptional regulator YafY